ncbi:MAG TPA: NlpC/P60 family protein [Streptosporangiaceae bacterium]|nr:NlpC/P60 family protein [Streptosporangiaceae bacterium]
MTAAVAVSGAGPAASIHQGSSETQHRAIVQSAVLTAVRHREASRLRAYAWALSQSGHWYVWGGTGPGYDCSGLVMMAYRHAGIRLPRTTTGMLASRLLVRVWHPRMGDLAFYGSWHVELFRRWGYTFGAHDPGTRVGFVHYGWGWRPTAFYRVR